MTVSKRPFEIRVADTWGALKLFANVAFTAITRVQIPSGTPINNQQDTIRFAETS
jgi:hypothetical protein